MTTITLNIQTVRETLVARDLDLVNPANITAFEAQAKLVATAMYNKPKKQDRDRVKSIMTTIWGLDNPRSASEEVDGEFDGSLDDLTDENTAGQRELVADLDQGESELHDDEDSREHAIDQEARDEADAADESEEDGKVDRSVVKSKFRKEYAARGNARNCSDWLARIADGFLLPKKKLDIAAWEQIAERNGLKEKFAEYTTAEKQLNNGWQGRARMSLGIPLRVNAARNNGLELPRALFLRMVEKLDQDNRKYAEKGQHHRVVAWDIFVEEDEFVIIQPAKGTPDQGFFADVIRKHGENNKTLAEGRKKAKKGEPARASEEGQG